MRRCWAEQIGNCSGKISREHIVSDSILPLKIKVGGFHWCKENPIEVGHSAFASKILCEKHNRDLSPYDSEILRFKNTIDKMNLNSNNISSVKSIPQVIQIDGGKLERWFLKTLINITLLSEEKVDIDLNYCLPHLFEEKSFEKPFGLNFAIKVGMKISTWDFLEFAPLLNHLSKKVKELAGGLFKYRGFYFIFLIRCSKKPMVNNQLELNLSPAISQDWIGLQLNWHNQSIKVGSKFTIQFTWPPPNVA